MVKRIIPLLLSVLLATALPPKGLNAIETQTGWQLVDETIAVVNGEPILLSDLKLYTLLFGERDLKKALQKLVDIYLVAQYAESRGLQIPPQRVNQIVENFAKSQGITVEQLYRELQKVGLGGAVFNNLIEKYNLYVGAIQLFVLKPLLENKAELELLIASRANKTQPLYTLEILKIPKELAEQNEDLLLTMDIEKIAQKLGIKPIKLTSPLDTLKPAIAKVVKRMSKGQTDFAEDKNYLYLVKVVDIRYEVPEAVRNRILKQIEDEKIREFINSLRENAVVKILPQFEEQLKSLNGGR